jgi:hypothetical protein
MLRKCDDNVEVRPLRPGLIELMHDIRHTYNVDVYELARVVMALFNPSHICYDLALFFRRINRRSCLALPFCGSCWFGG